MKENHSDKFWEDPKLNNDAVGDHMPPKINLGAEWEDDHRDHAECLVSKGVVKMKTILKKFRTCEAQFESIWFRWILFLKHEDSFHQDFKTVFLAGWVAFRILQRTKYMLLNNGDLNCLQKIFITFIWFICRVLQNESWGWKCLKNLSPRRFLWAIWTRAMPLPPTPQPLLPSHQDGISGS